MGSAPIPKVEGRRRANAPERGDWHTKENTGWQHGPTPKAPHGLCQEALEAWKTWFRSWAAAHWDTDDLPQLRQLARLYHACVMAHKEPVIWPPPGSNAQPVKRIPPATEFRMLADTMGITPKGQQDRRWLKPDVPKRNPAALAPRRSAHEHLTLVEEGAG